MVRRVGQLLPLPRPSGERALWGKNLCRDVQLFAFGEAVAVADGTEASAMAAIRMNCVRVSTGRAEDPRGIVAGGGEGIPLRHAADHKLPGVCTDRLMAVLGLARNA
jgi:hypothetical protein